MRFFSYCPDYGYETHATAAEAQQRALDKLDLQSEGHKP